MLALTEKLTYRMGLMSLPCKSQESLLQPPTNAKNSVGISHSKAALQFGLLTKFLIVQTIPFVRPLHPDKDGVFLAFASAQDMAEIHLKGAEIENRNDRNDTERFNNAKYQWDAWILAPTGSATPLNDYQREWVLLVQPPKNNEIRFPSLDDRLKVSFARPFCSSKGTEISQVNLVAERVDNPFETLRIDGKNKHLAAFNILPSFNARLGSDEEVYGPYAAAGGLSYTDLKGVKLSPEKKVRVIFELDHNEISYQMESKAMALFLDAEERAKQSLRDVSLDSLRFAQRGSQATSEEFPMEADSRQISAFKYILDPRIPPVGYVDIFKVFPHMKNPEKSDTIPQSLKKRFMQLNSHHKDAYRQMSRIPCGLHFVSGCPGAGKTHWNVLTAVIALSGLKANKERAKILYLIDMNKPVDDVASRLFKLCNDANIPIEMVRMRGWNREMKNSEVVNNDWRDSTESSDSSIALMKRFMSFAQRNANQMTKEKNSGTFAPSLDQATWKRFTENPGQYQELARLIASALKSGKENLKLRSMIKKLYAETLEKVDFIATTPVAASNPEFRAMFKPDIVFMDEAPHARELTSLIPIAMHRPRVWIFTGDHRQTLPFVSNMGRNNQRKAKGEVPIFLENPHVPQMQVSTMERVELLDGRVSSLMINHRAYGNLERLSSELFYASRMSSGIGAVEHKASSSITRVREWLCRLGQLEKLDESRILVHIENSAQGSMGSSKFNPKHENYALERIKELLADECFRNVKDPREAGRILVIAPYRAAIQNYMSKLKMLPREDKERIDVRTIDSAQGHEADLVILDLVRTDGPGFLNDKHRMNVAITRAQQGEIILMHPKMKSAPGRSKKRKSVLANIWEDMEERGQIVRVRA
ncbi:Regulator of nonsense transcripts 1 -like protein [Ceratocystis lukuohia]|uniref:Regulator of nonsense transcripts 1 -like protein n=1 Tax=Ceratocystis lukuohia TaxID=2019550 RepID=A0ABR4MRU6_9PEZI